MATPLQSAQPARFSENEGIAARKSERSTLGGLWPGFLLLAACSVFAWWACLRQFGGYDLSPLIDAFWRTRSGQLPGQDFINTFPVIIYLGAQLTKHLDLGWAELTLVNIGYTTAAFAAVAMMAQRDLRRTTWPLAAAAILVLPLVYTNHVWHSSSSQLAGAVFLVAVHSCVTKEDGSWRRFSWVLVSAAVLVTAKQNVALPMIGAGLLGAISAGGSQRAWLAGTIVVGSGFGIWLSLAATGMRMQDLVDTYTAVASRAMPTSAMMNGLLSTKTNLFVTAAVLAAPAIMAVRVFEQRQRLDRGTLFLLIMLPATLCPLATDWDTKVNDAVMPLLLVCRWSWDRVGAQNEARRPLGLLVMAVFVMALYGGLTRERMQQVGLYAFWEPVADQRIERGYLDGMHVGRRFVRVLGEIGRLHQEQPQSSVFFGPRLEFGYRLTNTSSPRGLPLWWHPGSSYAITDEPLVVRAFAERNFDTLVFLGGDVTRMPDRLLTLIHHRYTLQHAAGELQIYKRK